LDSLEARRWINDMICSFVTYEEDGSVTPGTNLPMVDGGTEVMFLLAYFFLPLTSRRSLFEA
jgi:hypothetical protein